MAVETFVIEETKTLIYNNEDLVKWQELVNQLGLQGQMELTNKEDKTPIPFVCMNAAMINMFSVLCPQKDNVLSYNKTPIPIEVLSLIALSEKNNWFHKIEIWHSNTDPDPLAVGLINDKHNSLRYLIGRWGDELRKMVELKKIAREKYIEDVTIKLKNSIATSEGHLKNVDALADKHLQGEWVFLGF